MYFLNILFLYVYLFSYIFLCSFILGAKFPSPLFFLRFDKTLMASLRYHTRKICGLHIKLMEVAVHSSLYIYIKSINTTGVIQSCNLKKFPICN